MNIFKSLFASFDKNSIDNAQSDDAHTGSISQYAQNTPEVLKIESRDMCYICAKFTERGVVKIYCSKCGYTYDLNSIEEYGTLKFLREADKSLDLYCPKCATQVARVHIC